MPNAEDRTTPLGGPYGSGVAEEAFVEGTTPSTPATDPDAAQPLVQNVFEPAPPGPTASPDDVLVQGLDLLPDEAAVLFTEDPDSEELAPWAPVLREIATLPNADPRIRALANSIDRRRQPEL